MLRILWKRIMRFPRRHDLVRIPCPGAPTCATVGCECRDDIRNAYWRTGSGIRCFLRKETAQTEGRRL